MLSCTGLDRCRLMLMLSCATPRRRRLMLVLCRTALSRCSLMLMLCCASLGGCGLMLTSGFGTFFSQVRRDGLDAKGVDRRHHDWRRGSSKRTGGVVARDHHRVIPCQQGTDTQQCNCALCHSTPNCRRRTVTPSARAYQPRSAPASLSVCESRDRPEVTSAKFAAVEGTMRHRGGPRFIVASGRVLWPI